MCYFSLFDRESAKQEVVDANEVLDGILVFASDLIKENYNDSIRIPDIREGFEKNVRFPPSLKKQIKFYSVPLKERWQLEKKLE